MKRKALFVFLFFAFALSGIYTVVEPIAAAANSLPKVLLFTTHGMGTKYYPIASGLAKVLSSNLETEVKVMPTSGPGEWMPMIKNGEVDLGIANCWDSKLGFLAEGSYEKTLKGKGSKIRLLTSGTPNRIGVLTSESSGIKTRNDMKGKRYVGVITGSASHTGLIQAGIENFGFTKDDIRIIPFASLHSGANALIEGRVDVLGVAALGAGFVSQLDAGRGARFISYDSSPEAVKRFQAVFTANPVLIQPGPGKAGIKGPTTLMQIDTYLVARGNLSDDVAYQLVKTLWEQNKELWPIHAGLKSWTTDRFVNANPTIPYHNGAIKFYKERGVWDSKMDKVQQKLLAME